MPTKYKRRNSAYLSQPHSGKKAPPSEAEVELNSVTLLNTYADDETARAYLEKIRWPEGPVCPHCASKEVTKLAGKATRPGVYKCKAKACRKQFTVTVGTVFEASHIRLRFWVVAFHAMCASKKGVSAHQLHRMLGITYKSAWFMCHRIRHAMDQGLDAPFDGTVEMDEAYVGGKPRPKHGTKQRKYGRGTDKQPVAVLVKRDGGAVCRPVENVTASTLRKVALSTASQSAKLMTDDYASYQGMGEYFDGGHETVNHSTGHYVRYVKGQEPVHTNTAESFFALLKRGHYGVFHQLSKHHLFRYCNEFAFRWTYHKVSDAERTIAGLQGAEGKRLTYR